MSLRLWKGCLKSIGPPTEMKESGPIEDPAMRGWSDGALKNI
jgi:hypothetical protein